MGQYLGREQQVIPWLSDAQAVAKAGGAVVTELSKAQTVPSWPDMHESLLELHAILSEWQSAAAATEEYVRHRLRTAEGLVEPPQTAISPRIEDSNVASWGDGPIVQSRSFVGEITFSASEVLNPRAPFTARWSRARRRVARRGLRTLLRVYAPDLLSQVESAINQRADWVHARRHGIDRWLRVPHSEQEASEFLAGMHATYSELAHTTDTVAAYIRQTYPIGETKPGNRPTAT